MEYEASSEQLWAVFFTAQLIEMQSKHPVLEQVDLVIEGGVGYGKALRRVIADVFPSALYVGVDLASWQSESIKTTLPDLMLESISGTNPPLLLANCFDYHLVKDICQKTSRVNPILIAVNADGALTSYWLQGDYQKRDDYIPETEWFTPQVPYNAQIFLRRSGDHWDDLKKGRWPDYLNKARHEADIFGWTQHRMQSGLAFIRE